MHCVSLAMPPKPAYKTTETTNRTTTAPHTLSRLLCLCLHPSCDPPPTPAQSAHVRCPLTNHARDNTFNNAILWRVSAARSLSTHTAQSATAPGCSTYPSQPHTSAGTLPRPAAPCAPTGWQSTGCKSKAPHSQNHTAGTTPTP